MQRVQANGITLEYEVIGEGEPLLLIGAVIADGYLPLVRESALARGFKLIRYHKRGLGASTRTPPPVSITTHAADAAALLTTLGIQRAHIVGHSSGGVIAMQLAIDSPACVDSLILLEPALLSTPSTPLFMQKASPAVGAYQSGDRNGAISAFLSAVSGLEWDRCRWLIEQNVPGAVSQAIRDADTFFEGELPALQAWEFDETKARAITSQSLLLTGTKTEALFKEGIEQLHAWLPHSRVVSIDGVGHLLHMQRPELFAKPIAEFVTLRSSRDSSGSLDPMRA
jgi:pimeloyl-ACP methyl ester carboxylesterase